MAHEHKNPKLHPSGGVESGRAAMLPHAKNAKPDCPVCHGTGFTEEEVNGNTVRIVCRTCFPTAGIVRK